MTNEELATQIKNGTTDLIPQLWTQTEKFIAMQARRYLRAMEHRGDTPAFEFDDLMQESYFALLHAVDYLDESKAGFLTALDFYLKTAFATVAGTRTPKQKNDGIRHYVPADAPLLGMDDLTLLDTLVDGGEDVEAVATAPILHQQLHDTLEEAMKALSPQQERILRERYYEERTCESIADQLGCVAQNISQHERTALKKLYNARTLNGLDEFLETHTNYWQKVGIQRFQNTHTSAVENIVLRREELAQKFLQSKYGINLKSPSRRKNS